MSLNKTFYIGFIIAIFFACLLDSEPLWFFGGGIGIGIGVAVIGVLKERRKR